MNYSNSLKQATGACCLCACLCLGGSAAYMTYSTTVQNVITMGSIQIELDIESQLDQDLNVGEGDSEITANISNSAPSNEVTVLPGSCVSYKVCVQNTGTDDAFIRIKLDCRAEPVQFQDFVGLDINYRFWTYQDGFLVYRDVVKPGQLTEPLFTTINFSPEYSGLPNAGAQLQSLQNPSCTVSVKAYAVQAANNAPNSLFAFGWPQE